MSSNKSFGKIIGPSIGGSSSFNFQPGKKFAVKIIRARDEEYQRAAIKEYSLLKNLTHPGIIRMVDAYLNK